MNRLRHREYRNDLLELKVTIRKETEGTLNVVNTVIGCSWAVSHELLLIYWDCHHRQDRPVRREMLCSCQDRGDRLVRDH